jgi:hypothetical protein
VPDLALRFLLVTAPADILLATMDGNSAKISVPH